VKAREEKMSIFRVLMLLLAGFLIYNGLVVHPEGTKLVFGYIPAEWTKFVQNCCLILSGVALTSAWDGKL
jgi:hypothetical protein